MRSAGTLRPRARSMLWTSSMCSKLPRSIQFIGNCLSFRHKPSTGYQFLESSDGSEYRIAQPGKQDCAKQYLNRQTDSCVFLRPKHRSHQTSSLPKNSNAWSMTKARRQLNQWKKQCEWQPRHKRPGRTTIAACRLTVDSRYRTTKYSSSDKGGENQ